MALREIVPNVWVSASSFSQITTSTVVATEHGSGVCIDPGVLHGELAALVDDTDSCSVEIVTGVATHGDWDHVLWPRAWQGKPHYASAAAIAQARRYLEEPDAQAGPQQADPDVDLSVIHDLVALPVGTVIDLSSLRGWPEGLAGEAFVHQAHSPGHVAIWFEQWAVLVVGDMLSDLEIPFLNSEAERPVDDYRHGLDVLEPLVQRAAWVIPGHGTVCSGRQARQRLDADRHYLDDLSLSQPVMDARLLTAPAWMRDAHLQQHSAAQP